MKTQSALRIIATLALIAALFACTANGSSIYATIETEQKINVSTLDQLISVFDIVNVGSGTYPYLVAAGAVYKGTVPDLNNEIGWPSVGRDPVPVSPPATGALCTALTTFGTGIYGAFFQDGPAMGLYKAVPGPNYSFKAADGATAITHTLVAGKQITLLQVANGTLFAVVATFGSGGYTYELDYSTDGSSFSTATGTGGPLTGLAKITGVAFFGSNYYVASGSTLYKGADPAHLDAVGIGNGKDLLQGVTADSVSNKLLIPSDNGTVFWFDGTSWHTTGTDDEINGHAIRLLTVSTHVDANGPGVIYLVGADGAGFYTLNIANIANSTLIRFSDVTVTGLYAGAVQRILVDPDPSHNNLVFMGTSGTGLWRASFDPATGAVNSTWIHE